MCVLIIKLFAWNLGHNRHSGSWQWKMTRFSCTYYWFFVFVFTIIFLQWLQVNSLRVSHNKPAYCWDITETQEKIPMAHFYSIYNQYLSTTAAQAQKKKKPIKP